MYKFDRLDFPKKYPIPSWTKILVIIAAIVGVLIHNCSQDNLSREIVISDIVISEYSKFHVDVEYTLHNKSTINRDVWLMLRVYDEQLNLLTSALFSVKVNANVKQPMIKVVDKFLIPIDHEHKPVKATIEVYMRKVMS